MLQNNRYYLKRIYKALKENESISQGYHLITINTPDFSRHVTVTWSERFACIAIDTERKEFRGGRASKYALRLAFETLEK